jgi:predicted RNase H-like HicB family nuclease
MSRALEYFVVVEGSGREYSGHALDLPCFATGKSHDEVVLRLREAIEFYLEDFGEDGRPIPEPEAVVEKVTVHVA